MKIVPGGVEFFHTDRGRDMKKLIVTLHNFANAPPKFNIIHASVASKIAYSI